MFMNVDQMGHFSQLHAFILQNLPFLESRRPRIWQAFKERCEQQILAKSAIVYGQGPRVVVRNLLGSIGFDEDERILVAGRFPHDLKDRIYLSTEIAETYEQCFTDELEQLVEGTLLHEAIHWARYHAKLRTGGGTEYNEWYEGGARFEREAYHRNFGSEWGMIIRRARHHHRNP